MFGILCFGDSITFGRGVLPSSKGWAGLLKEDFEKRDYYHGVYNLGIPGETAPALLTRFETEVKSRIRRNFPEDKYIIILAIGINDSREEDGHIQTPKDEFQNAVEKMVEFARAQADHVVLLGLTPVDEDKTSPYERTTFSNTVIREYDAVLKHIAKINGFSYVDLYMNFVAKDHKKLLGDGVHPNEKGYELMYRVILDELMPLLK